MMMAEYGDVWQWDTLAEYERDTCKHDRVVLPMRVVKPPSAAIARFAPALVGSAADAGLTVRFARDERPGRAVGGFTRRRGRAGNVTGLRALLRSRVWLAASVCSTFLLLSGCLEIAQHVTMVDRRTASVFVKVGIATAIIEMAGRFSDREITAESACEELTGSRDEIVPDYLPRNTRMIRFDAVDTRFECGMIFQFEYDVRVRREEATNPIPFLVWVTPREARIDLPIAGSGEPMDETALTFLASSKYRLTISKTVLKSVSAAQVTFSYQGTERTAELDVIDMVDQHLLELPMSTLFASEDVVTVTLRR